MSEHDLPPEDDAEEVDGEFVEIDIHEIGKMIADPYGGDAPVVVAENESSGTGRYRFWMNTPMGFREVEKFYAKLGDVMAEEEAPDVTN